MKLHMVKKKKSYSSVFFFLHEMYNVFFLITPCSINKILSKYKGKIHPEEKSI